MVATEAIHCAGRRVSRVVFPVEVLVTLMRRDTFEKSILARFFLSSSFVLDAVVTTADEAACTATVARTCDRCEMATISALCHDRKCRIGQTLKSNPQKENQHFPNNIHKHLKLSTAPMRSASRHEIVQLLHFFPGSTNFQVSVSTVQHTDLGTAGQDAAKSCHHRRRGKGSRTSGSITASASIAFTLCLMASALDCCWRSP